MMRLYERIVSGNQEGFFATLARASLAFIALLYLCAYYIRKLFYKIGLARCRKLPVPVISVGNLTLGGTGKTPFVVMLARYLKKSGVRVAVLSRGYGAVSPAGGNDEGILFSMEVPDVPLYASPNRYKAGLKAIEEGAQVLILDDGFQHWRLKRDLEIVLVDGINPFGYGFVFPRGFLREPVSALGRAEVVVLTHSDVPVPRLKDVMWEAIRKRAPNALYLEAVHQATKLVRLDRKEDEKNPSFLKDKSVLGFCGLGNPHSFFVSLAQLGARIKAFHALPDHFNYKAKIVSALEAHAKKVKCDFMVTTMKDGVKVAGFEVDVPLYALGVEVVVTKGSDELFSRVDGLLKKESERRDEHN
ncbi:MAG: tetraacyldisaccharide 4'-kinase [Planctomycetota bacterium]|nr:tetraacyldisaccharide 4'-kinase [Planctomycetota bacterium]